MTETTEPSGSSDTALWRQAIEICESLSGLNRNQALSKLEVMELAPDLLEKIHRIMENMSASNPLLDQHDYQSLIDNLKQGNHLIGKTIDGYLIKKLVAKGGMSTVYEAEFVQAKHQKTVAIKLLSPYGITEKAIELFNREQLILSKLSHPSIVAFHHSGLTADGTHYLVMEYLAGAENVVDYCSLQQFTKQQVVELVKNLCLVFSYAHEKQVIHRDIKPGNILVDENGVVKVIDFGIGRLDMSDGQTMTQVYTPDAAAPEQLMGQEVSSKTDVYSLGALLLQLLTKKKPLAKANLKNYDPQNDVKHLKKVFKDSDLGQDLQNILATAMHIDPALRYSSMDAFAEDLDNWLNHKTVNATSDTIIYRVSRFYQRNKVISVIASLVLVGVLVAGLIFNKLEIQNQKATSQRNSTFALLEAMIGQANPTTNDQVVDGDALVKSLDELAKKQAVLLASDHELSHFFYQKLGALYDSKGLYSQALDSYQKSLTSLRYFMSENDEAYISIELTVANLLETTGDFDQAKSNGTTLLKKIERLPGIDPRHQLNAYYLLAKVHQYQAENEISHEFGLEAIEWMNSHPDIDPPMQATMYNSMAVTNRNLGDLTTAEQQYLKAIEILRPFRERRIELSSILVNLAIFKGRNGDFVTSEELFLESSEMIKSIDEKHINLALNYLQYTTLLQITGRLDEANTILEQAISIFELHNMNRRLANAYMKYARIALIQYKVDVVLEYVIKSYRLSRDIYGLDHPEVFDLYSMALWVMMVEPYQAYGKMLVEQVETNSVEKALGSIEYKRFQLQKALVLKQTTSMDLPEAVITNYYFQHNNQQQFNADSEKKWLLQQLEIQSNKSDLITAWLKLQIALIVKDSAVIQQVCSTEEPWNASSHLAHKIMIIDSCLSQSEQFATTVTAQLSQLHKQVKQNTPSRIALFEQLLDMMK